MTVSTALALGSGLFWTATYLLIIRQGFADRTYGMPLVALAANLSWEFHFAFIYPHQPVQRTIDIVWLLFDLVIAYTVIRYGPREFPGLPRALFYAMAGGTLVLAYLGVWLFSRQYDHSGAMAAFAQNLMMSALFLAMLIQRRSLRGQSAWIAAAKLIGTALVSVSLWFYSDQWGSAFMAYLYLSILVLDVAYLVAVVVTGRRPQGSPQAAPG